MAKVRRKRFLAWVGAFALSLPLAQEVLVRATRIDPPRVDVPDTPGRSWARVRGGLHEVYLEGTPEAIGATNARLVREAMITEEASMWGDFERRVPWWIARLGIEDFSRVRYRHVDEGVPGPRRRELAAQALAFAPDPFAGRMPTYQRMLFLYALYDIALPLEHSPLIGCTSFAFATPDGHEIVARAFDFEGGDVFDRDKIVYLVREDGAIPFASVAWPGFVGVVTGMNQYGVVVIVHGARAGEPAVSGTPVAFSLRQVLGHAATANEAVELLEQQSVMVSHIVLVADGRGELAVVERAPGQPAYVRASHGRGILTNTFEGPLAHDPKNERVRETTTSDERAERVAELLRGPAAARTVSDALAILRDHGCARDAACALGDRRAVDGLLATHGIVADATARALWVSVGPHLSGAFVKLDLASLLAPGHDPAADPPPDIVPEDPILHDGRYEAAMAARARRERATSERAESERSR
jgi:hypothetical protein